MVLVLAGLYSLRPGWPAASPHQDFTVSVRAEIDDGSQGETVSIVTRVCSRRVWWRVTSRSPVDWQIIARDGQTVADTSNRMHQMVTSRSCGRPGSVAPTTTSGISTTGTRRSNQVSLVPPEVDRCQRGSTGSEPRGPPRRDGMGRRCPGIPPSSPPRSSSTASTTYDIAGGCGCENVAARRLGRRGVLMRLVGKVAIITGAAQGIGRAYAFGYARGRRPCRRRGHPTEQGRRSGRADM